MTTAWLLLLQLLVAVSCHSVDSQSTTDDQVCDGQHLSEIKKDVNELKSGIQRILLLLDNQQRRLGKLSKTKTKIMLEKSV